MPLASGSRAFKNSLLLVFISMLVSFDPRAESQLSSASDLNDPATHAAAAILRESKGLLTPPKVLVVDFTEMHGKLTETELGRQLAAEFSASLEAQSHGGFVIDRSQSVRSVAEDRLLSASVDTPDATRCYEAEVGGAVAIQGLIDVVAGQLSLGVTAWRIADHKKIFEERISLALNDQMRALDSVPASHSAVAPLTSEDALVNYEQIPEDVDRIAKGGTKGFSLPACIKCPNPEYSRDALIAKIQGIVLLSVIIGANGSATKISVIRGLPCGLNQQAIRSVAQWRFKPATDPDGKPAAVRQTIELTFHQY